MRGRRLVSREVFRLNRREGGSRRAHERSADICNGFRGFRLDGSEAPMIKSMTGFASLTDDDEAATITVTVRSVNHRFLDLQLRLPPTLAAVEPRLRTLVQQRVARGRVEVMVAVQQRRAPALEVELNEPFLQALGAALARAREQGYIDGVMTPGDLLRFPQALSIKDRPEGDAASEEQTSRTAARVEQAVAAALDDLDEMRTREGGFLRTELDARRQQLAERVRPGRAIGGSGARGAAGAPQRARQGAARRRACRRNDGRAGDRALRRPFGHHRRSRAFPRPPRALAVLERFAGAVWP